MQKRLSGILCVLLALTLFSSFCLSAFAAAPDESENGFNGFIAADPSATDDGVRFDREKGAVTMASGEALRLVLHDRLPGDELDVSWSSSDEDAASIAEDGTVTTGPACRISFFRYIEIPVAVVYVFPGPNRFLYLPLPFLWFPHFEGSTTISMTASETETDPETGETIEHVILTDSVKLTVKHTFKEWLSSRF